VVEVTGHPSGVKNQQPVSVRGLSLHGHLGGQRRPRQIAQRSVRVVAQRGVGHAGRVGRRGQLSLAQRGEVSGGAVRVEASPWSGSAPHPLLPYG
jgi:hypothetical protein